MKNLLRYIHSLTAFSDESWEALQPALTKKEFRKNEFLLKEGAICNTLFYIDRGYCRSYYGPDGLPKNIAFFFENDLATNLLILDTEGTRSAYMQKNDKEKQACLNIFDFLPDRRPCGSG